MNREKIVLGNYTYIVDLYKAKVDLQNPTYKQFYILRDQDFMSGVTNDKHIYFIDKEIYGNNQVVYPISSKTNIGYSLNSSAFDLNITEDIFWEGEPIGTIDLTLEISNLPLIRQIRFGVMTETGFELNSIFLYDNLNLSNDLPEGILELNKLN